MDSGLVGNQGKAPTNQRNWENISHWEGRHMFQNMEVIKKVMSKEGWGGVTGNLKLPLPRSAPASLVTFCGEEWGSQTHLCCLSQAQNISCPASHQLPRTSFPSCPRPAPSIRSVPAVEEELKCKYVDENPGK